MNNKQQAAKQLIGKLKKQIMNHTGVKKIRQTLKAPVKKILAPFGIVHRMIRPPMINMATFSGVEKRVQQPLNAVFGLVRQQHYNSWLNLVFGKAIPHVDQRDFRLRDIFQCNHLKNNKNALTVIFINHSDFSREADGSWFFIPEWVYGKISIPIADEYLRRENIKSDLRNIRKYGFQYDISDDSAFFDIEVEKRKARKDYDLLLVKKI